MGSGQSLGLLEERVDWQSGEGSRPGDALLPCSPWETAMALPACPARRPPKLQDATTARRECPICLQAVAGLAAVGCGRHRFCAECLCAYVRARNDLNADAKCPEPGCQYVLSVSEVMALCALAEQPAIGKRYAFLDRQRSRRHRHSEAPCCPFCKGWRRLEASGDGRTLACRRCELQICAACQQQAHPKVSCAEFADLRLQQAKTEQERQDLKQELLTRQFLLERTRPCPKCGIAVTKDWACNAVVCGRCHTKFCYSCLKVGDAHKSHHCVRKSNRETARQVQELLEVNETSANSRMKGLLCCGVCFSQNQGQYHECVNCPDFYVCNACWISGKTASRSLWTLLFEPSQGVHKQDHIFRAVV